MSTAWRYHTALRAFCTKIASVCWPGSSEQPTCYRLWLSVCEVTVMFAGVLEVTLRISLFLKAGEDDSIHPAKLRLPYPYVKASL